MADNPILEIRHYSKSYGAGKKAADDVSLSVRPGDIYGFIGHNGAGKSTTIRAVVGVLDLTEGEIFIEGHSVKDEPMDCKRITAYIPDNPDLYENLTGIQYLNFIADVFGISPAEREAGIRFGLDWLCGCDELWVIGGRITEGMKREIAVAKELGIPVKQHIPCLVLEGKLLDAFFGRKPEEPDPGYEEDDWNPNEDDEEEGLIYDGD